MCVCERERRVQVCAYVELFEVVTVALAPFLSNPFTATTSPLLIAEERSVIARADGKNVPRKSRVNEFGGRMEKG